MQAYVATLTGALSQEELRSIEAFRRHKHTAILAILFTDIVGSTRATEQLGEEVYSRLRHLHDELFMRIMGRDDAGTVVKQIGDSFLCVFAEPSVAVERAVEFQRALHSNREHLSSGGYTIKVRIGIHLGQVAVENSLQEDVFGSHVNRAARIESAASAGQVLTSLSVQENTVGWLKTHKASNIGQAAYGKARLKGIDEPVELFGFFPSELPPPMVPQLIRKQRGRKLAWYAVGSICILVLATSLFRSGLIGSAKPDPPDTLGPIYVQFELDPLARSHAAGLVDTIAFKESFMRQSIGALYPYRVIDEEALSASLASKGQLYQRHSITGFVGSEYFRDTLGLGGVLLVSPKSDSGVKGDSVRMQLELDMYYKKSPSISGRNLVFTSTSMDHSIGPLVQTMYMSTKAWTIQARVLAVQNEQLTFRLDSGAILVKGTPLRFMREYKGVMGQRQWSESIWAKLAFQRTQDSCAACLASLLTDSVEMARQEPRPEAAFAYGINVSGKVLTLYDTTGTAMWKRTTGYPDRPQPGDLLYLDY